MIRFILCLVVLALIAPILVMLYGGVFGQSYDQGRIFAGFLLFMLGCLVAALAFNAWGEIE